jgi:hypothetical protein
VRGPLSGSADGGRPQEQRRSYLGRQAGAAQDALLRGPAQEGTFVQPPAKLKAAGHKKGASAEVKQRFGLGGTTSRW